jgi:hypothetical protein
VNRRYGFNAEENEIHSSLSKSEEPACGFASSFMADRQENHRREL